MTQGLVCAADNSSHPSEAHKAACPACNPDKTVPELNRAFELKSSKQHCFQIPVGPRHADEGALCELLRQHGVRYWVNDMAVETVNGITRPLYTVPPVETSGCPNDTDGDGNCGASACRIVGRCLARDPTGNKPTHQETVCTREMLDDVEREVAAEQPIFEKARELSASEAASFDKTLARSPRRVETKGDPTPHGVVYDRPGWICSICGFWNNIKDRSCAGIHLESTPEKATARQPTRCNTAYSMNSSDVGESPCPQCGWPICEHPIRKSHK